MKPVVTDDRLPAEIEIRRERRRTIELAMHGGKLVARVPRRIARGELDAALRELRAAMNADLWRQQVVDDEQLAALAAEVAARHLGDQKLPPYQIKFVARMRKRWASCTVIPGHSGVIHVSRMLRGHPRWVLEHILLHELIHLKIPNHGPRFAKLMQRAPNGQRADGYLEALEHHERYGLWFCGLPEESGNEKTRPLLQRAGQIELFEAK